MRTLFLPLLKVEPLADGSVRVDGVVTDESVDSQGEVIRYEAAKAAFPQWAGNIREQHDPMKAVGRKLDVQFDDEGRRVILSARVSAGAPDTVKKVLDGTLTGFSVGGDVPESGRKSSVVNGENVTEIVDFRLSEVSLVDVPANPNSMFQIVKFKQEAKMAKQEEIEKGAAEEEQTEKTMGAEEEKGDMEPEAEKAEADPRVLDEIRASLSSMGEQLAAIAEAVAMMAKPSEEEAEGEAMEEAKKENDEAEKSAKTDGLEKSANAAPSASERLIEKIAKAVDGIGERLERIESTPVQKSVRHQTSKSIAALGISTETKDEDDLLSGVLSEIGDGEKLSASEIRTRIAHRMIRNSHSR